MAFDTRIASTSLKLITKFGSSCVITQQSKTSYDPSTSTIADPVKPVVQSVKGIVEEYAESIRFLGQKLDVPNSIVEGDKKVSIAGKGLLFIPTVGDSIQVFTASYMIIGVASIYALDTIVVYALHIRAV